MKNFQKGFAPIVILVIVIIIAAAGVGGYFVLKSKVAVAPTPSTSAFNNSGSILSFSIEPSRKDGGWTMYNPGAKATLIGKNLTSVSVTQCPTGTEIKTCPSVGVMVKVKTSISGDTWELALPANLMTTSFYAEAIDATGAKIKSSDLGNVGYEETKTADFKLYTSSKYGYSIQYPSAWILSEVSTDQGSSSQVGIRGSDGSVTIYENFDFGGGPCSSVGTLTKISTTAGSFMACVTPTGLTVSGDSSFLSHNNNNYTLKATWTASSKQKVLEVISTFKFNK